MSEEPPPVAFQAGFGLAVYTLVAPTIKLLLSKGIVTETEVRNILEDSINILKYQAATQGALEIHRWAINCLDSTVTALQIQGLFQSPEEKGQEPDPSNNP